MDGGRRSLSSLRDAGKALAVSRSSPLNRMQGTTPRTDFCRMLAAEGLLTPLADALIASAEDGDELADSAKAKICSIFLIFAQSDLKVKEALATRPVITREAKPLMTIVHYLT